MWPHPHFRCYNLIYHNLNVQTGVFILMNIGEQQDCDRLAIASLISVSFFLLLIEHFTWKIVREICGKNKQNPLVSLKIRSIWNVAISITWTWRSKEKKLKSALENISHQSVRKLLDISVEMFESLIYKQYSSSRKLKTNYRSTWKEFFSASFYNFRSVWIGKL